MDAKISSLAILSFIFSVLGLILFINLYYHIFPFLGMLILPLTFLLLSIIFGIFAIVIISLSKGKLKGKLFAIIGIIIGLFFILVVLCGMVI